MNHLKEFLATTLFEESHEVRAESFLGSDRDLEDLEASLAEEATFLELKDISAVDRFPLEVLGDTSLEKDLDKFSTVHDVLGNEIDIPVSVMSQVLVGFFLVSEEFPKVGQVD